MKNEYNNPVILYVGHKNIQYNKFFLPDTLTGKGLKRKMNIFEKLYSFFCKTYKYIPIYFNGKTKIGYIKSFIESKNVICAQAYLSEEGIKQYNSLNKAINSNLTFTLCPGDIDEDMILNNIKFFKIEKFKEEIIKGSGSPLRIRYRK
jgi:hypothetical protein